MRIAWQIYHREQETTVTLWIKKKKKKEREQEIRLRTWLGARIRRNWKKKKRRKQDCLSGHRTIHIVALLSPTSAILTSSFYVPKISRPLQLIFSSFSAVSSVQDVSPVSPVKHLHLGAARSGFLELTTDIATSRISFENQFSSNFQQTIENRGRGLGHIQTSTRWIIQDLAWTKLDSYIHRIFKRKEEEEDLAWSQITYYWEKKKIILGIYLIYYIR